LAKSVKGQIKVAYWDTEGGAQPPRLLGEIKGTPTIRLFKPKKKQGKPNSHASKDVLDYNGERMAKDMRQFLEYSMPDFTTVVSFPSDHQKAADKAANYGLPRAVLFTSKPKVTALLKYLSTEFRRKLLLIVVTPTKKNAELYPEYGITPDQLPALIVVDPDGKQIKYDGEDFSRRKLEQFLGEHALKEAVYQPIEKRQAASEEAPPSPKEGEKEAEPEPDKIKVEL